MQPANAWAFKEWAVVCEALASERQGLILRKGGLQEGREGFRVEHGEFWLFPTRYHQQPGELVPEARPLLEQALANQPPPGTIRLQLYAVVQEVFRVADEALLPRLAGLHVLSDRTVAERFHYRTPGLFVLPVRVYRLPAPLELPDSPHVAGCRSWVDLPRELSTEGLVPVLSDEEAERQLQRTRNVLKVPRGC